MPNIAIIEDQEIDSDSMKQLIETSQPGYVIHQYFDRKSAEEGLLKYQYELAIVDIDLGGSPPDRYGGFTILAGLAGKPVVALVVSGKPESDLEEMVTSLNAYDFLSKPYSPAAFLNTVKRALQWKPFTADIKNQLGFTATLPAGLEWDEVSSLGFKWKGKQVRLSMTHLRLVICLVKTPGSVVETGRLLKLLDTGGSNKVVAVHISGIRERFIDIDADFDRIKSDPGKGYVWKV